MKWTLFLILQLLVMSVVTSQQKTNPHDQRVELGAVAWHRDYDSALAEAKKKEKPVLILFQEVPGCSTCRNYGSNVLSHPLIVDFIENEFVPLAIYNNKGGDDRKILDKYHEPTWNNPVVHIVDANGKDMVPKVARNYSALGLYEAMLDGIISSGKQIPNYVNILGTELRTANSGLRETYYTMACFWTGEAHLGDVNGVVSSEPGWMSGKEVVKVAYDPKVVSEDQLDRIAKKGSCRPIDKHNSYKIDRDPQYYLKNSHFRYLPLTDLQKSKINSALRKGGIPEDYLSPTQRRWLSQIQNHPKRNKEMYTKDFAQAWQLMSSNDTM